MSSESQMISPENFQPALKSLEACLRNTEDSVNIIEGLLRDATEYYGADRTYVLEADWNLGIFINTYEHCQNGAESQMKDLQSIPFELMPCCVEALRNNVPIVHTDVRKLQQSSPKQFQTLDGFGIHSIIAVPFKKRINSGFLCVDNPTRYIDSPDYLLMLAYATVSELNEISLQDIVATYKRNAPRYSSSDVYINCFGQLEVVTPNGILREEDFTADLSYTIFLYLVINHNKHVTVQDLVDSVWEGMTLDASYKQAKNAVYRLRKTLSKIDMEELIIASHGSFALNPAYTIHTDIERFADIYDRILQERDEEILAGLYRDAIPLYKGKLAPRTDYYHWLIPKCVWFQSLHLEIVYKYVDYLLKNQKYVEVQGIIADALMYHPNNSRLYRDMILSLIGQKNLNLARVQYYDAESYLEPEDVEILKSVGKEMLSGE